MPPSRFALACVLLATPFTAAAWGPVGHHTICEIAYAELNADARAEVDRLVALDPAYENFATTCTFADHPERLRREEHYMNSPRSTRSLASHECPQADACVLTAITKDIAVLEDPSSSDAERLVALKLLGHWIGDVHQPLHVNFADDRGANWIPTVGECERNLHATWDSCIIESQIGTDYAVIAATLSAEITRADRIDWAYDAPVEWANESFRIAIDPATRYCVDKEDACWYDEDNFILSPGETQKTLTINRAYLRRHKGTVETRMQQAGVRLGATLNRVFEAQD